MLSPVEQKQRIGDLMLRIVEPDAVLGDELRRRELVANEEIVDNVVQFLAALSLTRSPHHFSKLR